VKDVLNIHDEIKKEVEHLLLKAEQIVVEILEEEPSHLNDSTRQIKPKLLLNALLVEFVFAPVLLESS